jgi:LacI family transcriptional regulator, galactose operon repressor
MAVTIKEVARRAGVSVATVSRVFNNVESVNEETLKLVRQVAKELKYFPNAVGRSLSTKKTESIGLLLPDLFGEFFSEVIRGSDEAVQMNHFHLLVSSSHSNREELEAALRIMRARIDGLIVMSPHINAQALNENLPHTLPVVLLNCYVEDDIFDSVNIDNFGGAIKMVQHLIGHGHKRIAFIKGTEKNFDAVERLQGYQAGIEQGGAYKDSSLELIGNFSEASGYIAAKNALKIKPCPTAIFASNDSMAIGALGALLEEGVDVPNEIAVVGFDDIPVAKYLSPPLTTVHFGIGDMGALAVKTLVRAINEKNSHQKQRIKLATNLSIRESCGCKK